MWWPRSRDLAAELPALMAALDSRGFVASRVTFDRRSWAKVASRLPVAGRIVRLHSSRSIDRDLVSLRGHDPRARIDLLVVPPGSHPATAAHAFARVVEWDEHVLAGAS